MALAQCPRSGGSIPSGGFARRGAHAQARAAMYIGDRPLWRAVLFPSPLTRAVHYDAQRRPDGVAAPRNPIPRTVAPLILIRLL